MLAIDSEPTPRPTMIGSPTIPTCFRRRCWFVPMTAAVPGNAPHLHFPRGPGQADGVARGRRPRRRLPLLLCHPVRLHLELPELQMIRGRSSWSLSRGRHRGRGMRSDSLGVAMAALMRRCRRRRPGGGSGRHQEHQQAQEEKEGEQAEQGSCGRCHSGDVELKTTELLSWWLFRKS